MHKFLLIDAGNTRIKWQFCERSEQEGFLELESGSITTEEVSEKLGLNAWLNIMLTRVAELKINSIYLASVLKPAWLEMFKKRMTGLRLHVPQVENSALLSLAGYDQKQLGVDRWLGCLAVAAQTSEAVNLLVSFGTATTCDAVVHSSRVQSDTSAYVHLGGTISPGVDLMMQSMARGAKSLPPVLFQAQALNKWPVSTNQAMCVGVQNAQTGLLRQAVAQLKQQFPAEHIAVWVTGGAYSCLNLDQEGLQVHLIPNAIFKGLQQCLNLSF